LIRFLSIVFFILIGCSDNPVGVQEPQTYPFELNTGLEQDKNGYYRLPMSQYGNGTQTIHQFSVDTNNPHTSPPQFVYWDCDTQVEHTLFGEHTDMVDIINHSSYATSEGIAYTMFGPHSDQIGDTVTVYVGYVCNEYDVEYHEYFQVILDSPSE
tara:strand:+ start:279 stop:743 length:465 start_codon:yes stop_codon:yes gene_type:complete